MHIQLVIFFVFLDADNDDDAMMVASATSDGGGTSDAIVQTYLFAPYKIAPHFFHILVLCMYVSFLKESSMLWQLSASDMVGVSGQTNTSIINTNTNTTSTTMTSY